MYIYSQKAKQVLKFLFYILANKPYIHYPFEYYDLNYESNISNIFFILTQKTF